MRFRVERGPKCAGQSMRRILEEWFSSSFQVHYFQQASAPPPHHDARPGSCVHGHFNGERGWGIDQYYPGAAQLLTVLRDPLDLMLSNYFYWKRRHSQVPEEEREYRAVSDFFRARPKAPILPFLPSGLDESNFTDVLSRRFVWIGLVENLDVSLPWLAAALGHPCPAIPHVNASSRDEQLPEELAEQFLATHRLEHAICRWVRETWSNLAAL